MIQIDGAQGEGGGQIIRSSLSLSAVTAQPIELTNIRAGRKKPGLLRQHLTAVRAVAEICDAEVDGAELGASALRFIPSKPKAGEYHFQIGSAGSACLVAQTVLPPLMMADSLAADPTDGDDEGLSRISTVTIEGGTHNEWAPPYDFLQRVFLPQLGKMGPNVEVELDRYGFYPAGGGQLRMTIEPAEQLTGLALCETQGNPKPHVTAIVSKLPRAVGERECEVIRRKSKWSEKAFSVVEVEDPVGPGNVVLIEWTAGNVTEQFTGFGKRGVSAENIARGVFREWKQHVKLGVPVGEYLADQLMLPMGLAASQGKLSSMRTGPLSLHSQTHLHILQRFLDIEANVEEDGDGVRVEFRPR